MRFDILTLFPEMFEGFTSSSILARAQSENRIQINFFNIRDFSSDRHRKVDDVPFGGGAGMLLMCQPLFAALEYVKNLKKDKAPVIFLTPQGETFSQDIAREFASQTKNKKISRIILLCGHYEGIDNRVRQELVDREISIGDYVLTGGETAAMVLMDCVSRLIPGVLGSGESLAEESFSDALDGKLEYPQYTRPEKFREFKVPEVLLSGHHAKIKEWKQKNCRKKNSRKI